MTKKSSDSHYVHYVHRVFYHWNVYKITFFTFLRNCQCKWVLWSIDSRTIIHVQAWNVLWTLRLLCCYWWHFSFCCVSLNFDLIVPLIKAFYLLQRRIKRNCLWNVNCCTQKREIKVIQIWNFRKIAKFTCREICAHENRDLNMSRKLHVTKYFNKALNCQEKSNYSICPLNKLPVINCSQVYCFGQQAVRKLNKEWKWCYLERGWIGFSALIISDVSFSVCGLQRGERRLWRFETWKRSYIPP